VYQFSGMTMLIMICFAYFHSIIEYGVIFWGNSIESKRVFQLQKKTIRIMTGSQSRTSCKPLFQSLELLTPSQYILSFMQVLSHNLEIYIVNFTVHGINTRNKLQLRKPTAYLTLPEGSILYEYKDLLRVI